MSSTVRFTPLHPLEYDYVSTSRNSHGAGVKILDREGLEDALPDVLVGQMDTRSFTETDEYPRQEWDLLLGFTTWGRDEEEIGNGADYHNVSNTGEEEMAETWATVSEYTEPFIVWQTSFEGAWPHAAEIDGRGGSIYRVEARDGAAEMEQLTLGVVEREAVHSVGKSSEDEPDD